MLFGRDSALAEKYPTLNQFTNFVKAPERDIIGRTEEMRAIWASMLRPELCNVILIGEAGSGKALDDDTLIPVADCRVYVPIAKLKTGDTVFDENGKPARISGVFPQGKLDAYKITFSDGTSVICNDEHLWAAREVRSDKKHYRIYTLRQMCDAGISYTLADGSVKYNWCIPSNFAVEREESTIAEDFWAAGVYISNGCNTDGILALNNIPESVADRFAETIQAKPVRLSENESLYRFVKRGEINSPRYIRTGDVLSGLSINRRSIPLRYLDSSVFQRYELLRGMMDAGGCVLEDGTLNCVYTTKDKSLVSSFGQLLNSLGIRYSFTSSDVLPEYAFVLTSDAWSAQDFFWREDMLEIISKYAVGRKLKQNHRELVVTGVERLEQQRSMTCIYVSSPNHLFQAGTNHIVTHNTMLVQGTMMKDTARSYLDVNLSNMISVNGAEALPGTLESLFSEIIKYKQEENNEIVLFIDEFHRIIQESPAAVEALKPLLADSGTRGIKIIAATTFIEFQKWISPNQPLVERLQRINITQPGKKMTIAILKGMAKRYGVDNQFFDDHIYEMIYEYTNRYIPANSQPRKSILVLDNMIGWHRAEGRKLDVKLLADVIYQQEGINVAFRVDATKIKEELDKHVLAQQFATSVIEQRLQICVADLNNKSKPMSSFLFTGATGVGKCLVNSTVMPVCDDTGTISHKKAGDVQVGDYLFDRLGQPTKVLGVFPQGKKDVYRVTLGDGRCIDVSDNHLWAVYPAKRARDEGYTIYSTQTLINKGLETRHGDRVGMKYCIPMNQPVQWAEQHYDVDPYVIGALIGDGLLTSKESLLISSDDEFVVAQVAEKIGAASYQQGNSSYSWHFYTGGQIHGKRERIQLKDICGRMDEIYMKKSPERRLPKNYMIGSIEQRWDLIHGLFDTDGSIGQCDGDRYNISYSTHSEGLAYDIQEVLYSLGVPSSVTAYRREPDEKGYVKCEWSVHVKSRNQDKYKFFTLPRKLDIAKRAVGINKQREKTFDYVGIRSIEKLDYQEDMVCFYVDNDEHLYQAGQYIVTHNTEMAKQLTKILFEDDRRLCRFDMTEYASAESLERFRQELTSRVWSMPYCIILLDEIEKACSQVTRLLLQVLDDGRLMDQNNREVVFTNCYIILTTNAGSEIYKNISQYNADDTGSGAFVQKYDKLIRASISGTTGDNRFPPELLGRIDCIVPFQPLSEQTMMKIVEVKLKQLRSDVRKKHGVKLHIERDVIKYLVIDNLDTDSDSGGARVVMSKLESEVTTAVAKYINAHPGVKDIGVRVRGSMRADNKYQLESEAYIDVVAVKD